MGHGPAGADGVVKLVADRTFQGRIEYRGLTDEELAANKIMGEIL